MKSVKIFAFIVLVVVVAAGSSVITTLVTKSYEKSRLRSSVLDELQKFTKELNEQAPAMLSEEIRLDGARLVSDDLYEYKYTVITEKTPEQIRIQLFKIEKDLRKFVNTHESMSIFRENDIGLNYIYRNPKGEEIYRILVKPEDYKVR